jgi:hypothetical protein
MAIPNQQIAGRLDEAADLLHDQGADPVRVGTYRHAADTVRQYGEPLAQVFRQRGLEGLAVVPGVGPGIARAIRELVTCGRLPMLERLRGEDDPVRLLASVPGIGTLLAERLHDELGVETLEALEAAVHDRRLDTMAGFRSRRLAGIGDSLAYRLGRVRRPGAAVHVVPVAELLDVDREYRDKAAGRELPRITPQRFNPAAEAWLPVLHTQRGDRRYTAIFSNTARAHRAGRTRDWVVLYTEDEEGEQQYTVVTATHGALQGRRVVGGREREGAPSTAAAA